MVYEGQLVSTSSNALTASHKLHFQQKRHILRNNKILQTKRDKVYYKYIKSYLENTSVHGLSYIGDAKISFGERLCWLFCFIAALLSATYFISLIYLHYNENPVIVTANPRPASILDIPFPSLTICNMNKVKRTVATTIVATGTDVEKSILINYCNEQTQINTTLETDKQSSNWNNILKFILKAGHPCKEIIKVCIWRSSEISCEKWFNPILTDEGLCCTFNEMPNSYIFRYVENFNQLSANYPTLVEDWNQETGFRKTTPIDAYPWRTDSTAYFGLTLVLNAMTQEHYCSSTGNFGFKMLIHNPMETPAVADFGSLVQPGKEIFYEIAPVVRETSFTLKSVSVRKRQCYFSNEKYLRFFRLYTDTNCKQECRANYTLKICGCVPFFLPRSRENRICGFKDSNCTIQAEVKMQLSEVQTRSLCGCLPGCFELSYDKSIHSGLLHKATVKRSMTKNMSLDYFTRDVAIVHLYFFSPLLSKLIKRELYGFTEFLSNTGGLLGLFLGFSVLSAVELGYYLSLRIFCFVVRSKQRESDESQEPDDNAIIYPFVN